MVVVVFVCGYRHFFYWFVSPDRMQPDNTVIAVLFTMILTEITSFNEARWKLLAVAQTDRKLGYPTDR